MDDRAEVGDFLTTRRAEITPAQAGIPPHGLRRRVLGLRREEVAQLSGVSTDYDTRLEKGNLSSGSDSVLEAIARALQLDDAERAHLSPGVGALRGHERGHAAHRGRPRPARQGAHRPGR